MPFVFLLVDVWFRGLADDGFLSTGASGPDVLGTVAAGHDERGEVGVVVMRAEAWRALAGLDADLDESRAAALIALTGGLDAHRKGVI
jgi:hypothetical protein